MNKSLSLLFCLSFVLPLHAMEMHDSLFRDDIPQPYLNRSQRIWEKISCKKVFIAVACVVVVGLISASGYFMTSTCLEMKADCYSIRDGCTEIKNGSSTLQNGCNEMKSACNNCTTDFSQASCGLKMLTSAVSLLKNIAQRYPEVALQYGAELSKLNGNCL